MIFSAPIVLFVVCIIEFVCFVKGKSESLPKTKLRKHLYCMLVCFVLMVIIIAAGCIVLRYV
ncbi:MAG: hypothetical protein J6X11_03965 [Treponema sp.]|nr:hypothetical protein [Treponema sp.]MBQ1592730.1 hypothetical protein [Treponema sp.]MBR4386466.1 hypothetical protein [Treponema sp.]